MSAEAREYIERYVTTLKDGGWIESDTVERAFRRVQRHQLIERVVRGPSEIVQIDPQDAEHLQMIYANRALLTRPFPDASSSSEPTLVAMMLERLELQPGMRVLEIGAGTGYNAALMAELVGDPALITTIDIQEEVVEETRGHLASAGYGAIRAVAGDGFYGHPDGAPYDRIVATVGCADLSPHWLAQLAPGGAMLIPLAHGSPSNCPLVRAAGHNDRAKGHVVAYSGFMPIHGVSAADLGLSRTEMRRMWRCLQEDEPMAERPLPEGMYELTDLTPRIQDKWGIRLEFLYFLALHTGPAFDSAKGLVLGDAEAFVVLGDDAILLYGEGASPLLDGLEGAYHAWETRGKPRMVDYALEFVSRSEATAAGDAPESSIWVVDRKYFRQFVRLRG
jgi:protein-L-isoaspartate(D-aspartate) O-methyltransferase